MAEYEGDDALDMDQAWIDSDPEWFEIHPDLILDVILNLLDDMDEGGYF